MVGVRVVVWVVVWVLKLVDLMSDTMAQKKVGAWVCEMGGTKAALKAERTAVR